MGSSSSSSTTNAIKALVQRFVSLQPAVRLKVTKKLLELSSPEQLARATEASPDSGSPVVTKSFLEQFWDEVEKAHGDDQHAVNPFSPQRSAGARSSVVEALPETDLQEGYLHWRILPSDLFARL
jgi:hypothetical protein